MEAIMLKRVILPGLLILLVGTVTYLGVFHPGDGSTQEAISPRGQQYSFLSTGIYRLNPVFFAREGRVWDAVNLFIAVPLFLVAWVGAGRNSLRGRLLLGGIEAYFLYVYLGSVMMYAFSELFVLYVGIVALSSVTFLQTMTDLRIDEIPTSISGRFPRMLFVGYSFVLAASLLILWTARILGILRTGLDAGRVCRADHTGKPSARPCSARATSGGNRRATAQEHASWLLSLLRRDGGWSDDVHFDSLVDSRPSGPGREGRRLRSHTVLHSFRCGNSTRTRLLLVDTK